MNKSREMTPYEEEIIKETADRHRTCGNLPKCLYLEDYKVFSLKCCLRVVDADTLHEAIILWNKSQREEY